MKIKILFATLLTLALFTAGHAQTLPVARPWPIKSILDLTAEPLLRRLLRN